MRKLNKFAWKLNILYFPTQSIHVYNVFLRLLWGQCGNVLVCVCVCVCEADENVSVTVAESVESFFFITHSNFSLVFFLYNNNKKCMNSMNAHKSITISGRNIKSCIKYIINKTKNSSFGISHKKARPNLCVVLPILG